MTKEYKNKDNPLLNENKDEGYTNPVTDAYQETIGSVEGLRLLAHVAALTSGGALAGRAAAPFLTKGFKGQFEGSEDVRKKLMQAGALAGGALGTYTGSRGLDYSSARDFLKSMFVRDYWEKNPEKAEKRITDLNKKIRGMDYAPQYSLLEDKRRKTGGDFTEVDTGGEYGTEDCSDCNYSAFTPSIPVKETQDVINEDPYMHPFGKTALNGMLENADKDRDDKASQFDLSDAALKAGAGFVPSYLLGRSVGSLMRLPKDSKKRLSNIGGIAGAVANTGILNDL